MSSRDVKVLAGAVILAATCAPVRGGETAGPPTAVVRAEIERLETRLDRAVDRVSLPHPAALVGRADSARGYRLPGYGLVFVLPPRRLPGMDGTALVLRGDGPRRLVRVETRHRAPADHARQDREEREEEEIENLERQVLALQARTEQARRAAEQEMERLVHDVRVLRLAPSGLETPQASPPPPAAPERGPSRPRPKRHPLRRPRHGSSGSRRRQLRTIARPKRSSRTSARR
jgi:hypothetical protein